MNEKTEQVETEEIETEIPAEEIVDAIDNELAAVAAEEPEPAPAEPATDDGQPEPEPEPEPEPKKDDEAGEKESEDDPKPEPEPETKPSDEFGSLEEGTPEKTRERFETLKGRFDEVSSERDAAIKERDEVAADAQIWKDAIIQTGTNQEQFGMALTYLSKLNSGKIEDLHEAYAIMENELKDLGAKLGKPAPGGSPLDAFPDLKERVDDGYLDEKDAIEIAEARASRKVAATAAEQSSAQDERTQKVNAAVNGIKQLGEELEKTDPQFKHKAKLLEPMIQAIVQSAPNAPEQWVPAIKAAYEKIPNVPVSAPTPAPTPAPNSIRPTGASPASGGMDKEPGSAYEAVDLALSRGF